MIIDNLIAWFQMKYPDLVDDLIHQSSHYGWADSEDVEISKAHTEGSTWSHIMMVLCLLKNHPEYNETKSFWVEIAIALLLHDIGKSKVAESVEEKRHVYMIGHAGWSTIMSINILKSIARDFPELKFDKDNVLNLINWHDWAWISGKNRVPEIYTTQGLNSSTALQLLYIMNFDGKGKFSLKSFNSEIDVSISEGISLLTEILNNPPISSNDVECKKGKSSKPDFIIMSGLPGSGKSYYSRRLKQQYEERGESVEIVSFDDTVTYLYPNMTYDEAYHIIKSDNKKMNEVDKCFKNHLKSAIDAGKHVIVDMTNLTMKSRRKKWGGLKKDTYNLINYCILTELPRIFWNCFSREVDGKTIPVRVIQDMVGQLYLPFPSEFDEIHYIYDCHHMYLLEEMMETEMKD